MCGKFTAMASWREVAAFSQPLNGDPEERAAEADREVIFRVMSNLALLVWANIRQPNWAHWRPWMEPAYRCLVPATSFCEYQDGSELPTWFALSDDRPPFFFASVWMPWTGHRGTKANPADGDHLLYSFPDN